MKSLFLLAAFSLVATCIHGQSMWGMNFKVFETKGDFNKNVAAVPVGISFNYLHRLNDKFSLGGELGVAMYANNQYQFETSSGPVTIDEEDCFWTLHADLRYFVYQNSWARVYTQARLGITTFFSEQVAQKETPEFKDKFEFHGTAFNTGIGSGVVINFKSLFKKQQGKANLDLGVALHSGSPTVYRYMSEGSQSTSLNDGVFRSVTNYVDYRVGVLLFTGR